MPCDYVMAFLLLCAIELTAFTYAFMDVGILPS